MFNIKSFRAALAALTAARDERASTMASFLSDAVSGALTAQLIEGSDSFNQLLNAVHASGKSAIAGKLRKSLRNMDFTALSAWGHVACTNKGFSFTTVQGYIGGNSRKCQDIAERKAAIEVVTDSVAAATMSVFAPAPAGEKAGPFDFLVVSAESLTKKVAACDRATLEKAQAQAQALAQAIAQAIASMPDSDADSDADADAAAAAAAAAAEADAAAAEADAAAAEADAAAAEADAEADAAAEAPAKPAKRQRRKTAVAA